MNHSPDHLQLLASAFTRPVFAQLARTGDALGTLKALVKGGAIKRQAQEKSLAILFDEALSHLAKDYRNEYVYKNDLASRLIFGRHSPRTASFHVEMPVGQSIVDVAVANGTTTAYEIKTEFDTAKRLKSQTSDYLRVFDKVFVVTHPAHLERFASQLDSRVGLIVLSKKGALSTYREAMPNAANVEAGAIFRCLRRAEYLSGIKELFGEEPQLANGHIHAYCEKLFSTAAALDAHDFFVKALRARTTDKSTVEFVAQLPPSLRALGYATPLSGRQRETMLALLARPIGLAVAS